MIACLAYGFIVTGSGLTEIGGFSWMGSKVLSLHEKKNA